MTPTATRTGRCYVYGLVRDDGGPLPPVTGIGGAPLRLVRAGPGAGSVAAVVSDADGLERRVRRSDLLAHSDVLQALVEDRDVVPVRFGSVYASDDQMRGELLAANAGGLRRLLEGIAGMVEMQVKATYEEGAVTADIAGSDRRLQKLRDRTRVAPGDNGAQIELGRRFAALLDGRRAADATRIARQLDRVSGRTQVGDGPGDFGVVKVSCLVTRAKLAAFDDAIDRLARDLGGGVKLAVLGPLPPYTFVAGAVSEVG